MRTAILAAFTAFFLASAARADDTRPPQISDVKASASKGKVTVEARITDETGVLSATVHHRGPGGKVEDTPMIKNDYDDVFKATFSGGGDTEYWIDSSDLLGNGPSTYGSASKAMAVGGGKSSGGGTRVAEKEETQQEETPREKPPPRGHHVARASSPQPPVIVHRKPGVQPPEGKDFTLRMQIKADPPVAVAILQAKPEGASSYTNVALKKTEGENYEAQIPAAIAHGNVEYYITAKNDAGQITRQGDGDSKTPYVITFKGAPAVASQGGTQATTGSTGTAAAGPQPYTFTDLPPYRVIPGKPFVLRAQVVPSTDDGQAPDKVAVLWRGADAQDQFTEMVRDDTGGLGGYKAQLPEQPEGAVFFQIVACADSQATKCGIDTGSKRKWHATVVASSPGAAQPMPLDAVSTKGPPSLPE
ncbi:MAG TPA: hypothetical protein VLW85_15815 [Myxococcales bacterium]|nr:hypothetical protein [Myxococcales bacterium]